MATVAEIQAQLDPNGYKNQINIVKQLTSGTTDFFYCTGGQRAVGKDKWVTTTNTDSAAAQATAITNAMIA